MELFEEGKALFKLGKYDKAMKCFDKAIEIKPNDANAWNRRILNK